MEGREGQEIAASLEGKKVLTNLNLAFVESMALKCVIELGIADIIHSHGSPMSLNQIATKIDSKSLNLSYLSRVMRLLVHKSVFATINDQSDETLYALTSSSRLLLHDSELTMVPIIMMSTHPKVIEPWHQLSASVKDGENPIQKSYGSSLWEILSMDQELNHAFNTGLESSTKFTTKAFLATYKHGFHGIETLVDVGGGIGHFLFKIVQENGPLMKGINFDLHHVVDNAPSYPGVTHVGGDMFESIPYADGIIMKSLLHNWNDEDCKKILSNCRTALSKTKVGKLVVVEMVEGEVEDDGSLGEVAMKLDLLMMVHCIGGKERSRIEWTSLLEGAGFCRINFIKIPTIQYIIEAYATEVYTLS